MAGKGENDLATTGYHGASCIHGRVNTQDWKCPAGRGHRAEVFKGKGRGARGLLSVVFIFYKLAEVIHFPSLTSWPESHAEKFHDL